MVSNELICIWMQIDTEKHHGGERSQNPSLSKAGDILPPMSLFHTVVQSKRVNFRSAMLDTHAELVGSTLNSIY